MDLFIDTEVTDLSGKADLVSFSACYSSGPIFHAEFTDYGTVKDQYVIDSIVPNLGSDYLAKSDILVNQEVDRFEVTGTTFAETFEGWKNSQPQALNSAGTQVWIDGSQYGLVLYSDLMAFSHDPVYRAPVLDLYTYLYLAVKEGTNKEDFLGIDQEIKSSAEYVSMIRDTVNTLRPTFKNSAGYAYGTRSNIENS